jgi:hypothetical protein
MRAMCRHRRPEGRAFLGCRTIRMRATEACRLHYPVGRGVLTIANHAVNASSCRPPIACPSGKSRATSTLWIGVRNADRVPCSFAGRLSIVPWRRRPKRAPRRMPIRGAVRVAPTRCAQNNAAPKSGQSPIDRFFRRHTTGHHVVASRRAARRHRQGPKAARQRGRSEAQSLARCRAQIEHQRRDGRWLVIRRKNPLIM